MLISHFLLKNFGKFESFECDFSPGLNVIKGPSEAGKSTLVEAVSAALFLNPAAENDHIPQAVRWGTGNAPVIEAFFDIDGKSFKLTKDFERGVAQISGGSPDSEVTAPDAINQWLAEKTGIPSEKVFKATACVSQGAVTRIDESIEAIQDKLESLVTGGREDQAGSMTIRKIEKRIADIALEISRSVSVSEELDYNINRLARDIEGLKKKRADLIQVETAYKNVCDDLASREEKLKWGRRASNIAEKATKLSDEYILTEKKLKEGRELHSSVESLRAQKAALKKIDQNDIKLADESEKTIAFCIQKNQDLAADLQVAEENLAAYKISASFKIMGAIGFLGSAALTAAHYFSLFPRFYPHLWYSLAGSISLCILGLSILNSRKKHRQSLADSARQLAEKLDESKTETENHNKILFDILSRYRVSTNDELKKNSWSYDEIGKRILEDADKYVHMMKGQTLEALQKQFDELSEELDNITREKEELAPNLRDRTDLERQMQVIAEFQERIKDLEHERQVIRLQIETAEGGSELLASYNERKERANSGIESLKKELRILGLTKECVEEARQNVLMSKLEVLNRGTSEILSSLTSGRYSKVRFDKSNLKFEVWSEEKGDWVDPDTALSSNTVEQIYLAARLALADLISESRNSVLILDDPFAGFDPVRISSAMKVLKELSGNHQILLLTSQDHYDQWADRAISL